MNVQDPTGRLARWPLQLQQSNFDIIHRPGSVKWNADALLCITHLNESVKPSAVPVSPVTPTTNVPVSLPITPIDDYVPSVQHLHFLQRQDKDLCDII